MGKRPIKRVNHPKTARRKAATVNDVLSAPPDEADVPSKWKTQFRRLVNLRDELLGRRGNRVDTASEAQPSFSQHMADAATDEFDRDFALGALSAEQDALYEIDQALNRIRNGSYGICEVTGKKISPERLNAVPWTRFSVEAERDLEKRGAVTRTSLGERERVPKESTVNQIADES